jgi:hypothetical protein
MTKTSDIPPQLEASVEEKRKFARDWTEMIEFISSRQLDSDWVVRVLVYHVGRVPRTERDAGVSSRRQQSVSPFYL